MGRIFPLEEIFPLFARQRRFYLFARHDLLAAHTRPSQLASQVARETCAGVGGWEG